MIDKTDQLLIIDSTRTRRKDLCRLWSDNLGYDVAYCNGSEVLRFKNDSESSKVSSEEQLNLRPLACLFHVGDFQQYKDAETKRFVDSSRRVVMFSGAGLVSKKTEWPENWLWIPRPITGKGSASDNAWRELADWFKKDPSSSTAASSIALLSVRKRPQFLIALHILCQGYLAAERMHKRVPTASAQANTKEWWSVPLLQSAGGNLVEVITEEWGGNVPPPVLDLVNWITDTSITKENPELSKIISEAQKELESRVTK